MPFALTDEDIASVHGALQPRHRDFEFSQDWFVSLIEAPSARLDPYWAAIGLRECGACAARPRCRRSRSAAACATSAATLRNALAGARPVYRDRVQARLAALAPLLGLT